MQAQMQAQVQAQAQAQAQVQAQAHKTPISTLDPQKALESATPALRMESGQSIQSKVVPGSTTGSGQRSMVVLGPKAAQESTSNTKPGTMSAQGVQSVQNQIEGTRVDQETGRRITVQQGHGSVPERVQINQSMQPTTGQRSTQGQDGWDFFNEIRKQSDNRQAQSKQLEKIYSAIVNNPQKSQNLNNAIVNNPQTSNNLGNGKNIFLQKLYLSYDKREEFLSENERNVRTEFTEFEKKLKNTEDKNALSKRDDVRKSINEYRQYTAIIDKVIALKTAEKIRDHSGKILGLSNKIQEVKGARNVTELQTRIKTQLAMSKNESTQLQMAAHLRNAEQALMNQQKRQHNMRIFDSKNTTIPTIQ